MDPINWGVFNLIESVINNVFIQRPNVDAIQQGINSCHENNGISVNQDASPTIIQGASTTYCPILTRTLHKNVPVVTPRSEKASAKGAKKNSSYDDSQVSVNSVQKNDDSLVAVNSG